MSSPLVVLSALALLCGCVSRGGQVADDHPSRATRRSARQLSKSNAESLPADMGSPLTQSQAEDHGTALSVDAPIASVAAAPDGRAVLEKDLPGLLERPEFPMFKSMSLKTLAGVSHGKISTAKLNEVEADLMKADLAHSR